jgi:UDP:flavonoid glycosyltransferase YjiC (YdhE family)
MKILLVTRGSMGDCYPFLSLAAELKKRGHFITLSLPRLFEKEAKEAGINYSLQATDDIKGMIGDEPDTKNLLEWTGRVVDSQFKELIPLLNEHDLLIAANTEFAAASVAEYCGKPLIRTAFGPFIPSRKIAPPVFRQPKPHFIFKPPMLWKMLNIGLNLMTKKPINKNRKALGMPPIKDQGDHAPANADNLLMYSKHLGNYDNDWKYKWKIGGYCFNDSFLYDEDELQKLVDFIKKDSKPTVSFSLGSCNIDQRDRFAELLFDICTEHNYKLIVACGWWNVGEHLQKRDNLFRMEKPIPHCKVFPQCDAIIHHGGAGTTHSAARSGKPQMIAPILLDQFYWSQRIKELGIGPGAVKIKGVSRKHLERKVLDLVNNLSYKEKAHSIGQLIRNENSLEENCKFIESFKPKAAL